MTRLIRLAFVSGAVVAAVLLAGPAGAVVCPPGTTPVEVCLPGRPPRCVIVCVPIFEAIA